MTWIKICGITNSEDAINAYRLGVNAVGFIFAPSPRRIEPDTAKRIIDILPDHLFKVGVFVNEEIKEVKRIANYCGLNLLQFSGYETPDYCKEFDLPVIKAIHIRDYKDIEEIERFQDHFILLDTYSPSKAGGTGKTFSWDIALKAKGLKEFILSGGLNPLNVREAIKKVSPWGVDVCSGVEKMEGRKDFSKMVNFVMEVKSLR